jgi:hypothetical protein
MISTHSGFKVALLAAGALALAGCGSDSKPGTGIASFYMTDAPVDEADAVVLGMTHFELKPAEGAPFRVDFDEGLYNEDGVVVLDILDYTKGLAATLVSGEELPAGNYEWLRIFFDEDYSYIEIEGNQYSFFMPSGAQTGFKAIGGFTVPVNQEVAYMLDFDVRQSVLEPPGLGRFGEDRRFLLKPTVRLMNLEDTGGVAGLVNLDLLAEAKDEETCAGGDAVYAFEGAGVDPLGEGVLPLVSDTVTLAEDSLAGEYALMYLLPGDYTLAFTCSALLDTGDGETYAENYPGEGLAFHAIRNVEILSGEVVECNFLEADGEC